MFLKKFAINILTVLLLISSTPIKAEETEDTAINTSETQEALEQNSQTDSSFAEDDSEEEIFYFCNKEEHTHNEQCYDSEGSLICEKEEHIHNESCNESFTSLNPEDFNEVEDNDSTVSEFNIAVEHNQDLNINNQLAIDSEQFISAEDNFNTNVELLSQATYDGSETDTTGWIHGWDKLMHNDTAEYAIDPDGTLWFRPLTDTTGFITVYGGFGGTEVTPYFTKNYSDKIKAVKVKAGTTICVKSNSNRLDDFFVGIGKTGGTIDMTGIEIDSNIIYIYNFFKDTGASSIILTPNFNKNSSIIGMGNLFENCQTELINLTNFNTAGVKFMFDMFKGSKFTSLDLSSFDTKSVTDMSRMFQDSTATLLDLSSFDTSNVTKMEDMFKNSQVTTLILGKHIGFSTDINHPKKYWIRTKDLQGNDVSGPVIENLYDYDLNYPGTYTLIPALNGCTIIRDTDQTTINQAIENGCTKIYVNSVTVTFNDEVTIPSNKNITIEGIGTGIFKKSDSNQSQEMFYVNGGSLILNSGISVDGRLTNNQLLAISFALVDNNGSLELNGAIISNFNQNNKAVAAPIVIKSGTFTLTDGAITGTLLGYTADGSKSSQLVDAKAIRDYVKGLPMTNTAGAIYATGENSHVYINGGTISGNRADAGAIIVTDGAILTMNGGTIDSNIGVHHAGAVQVERGGKFILNNGTLSNNIAWNRGGAVWVTAWGTGGYVQKSWANWPKEYPSITNQQAKGEDGIFVMNGGVIDNNLAFVRGGGINVESTEVFLNSGQITNNISRSLGGGIYVEGDSPAYSYTLMLKDAKFIDNQSYSDQNSRYTLGYAISNGQRVAISSDVYDSDFSSKGSGNGGALWLCSVGGSSAIYGNSAYFDNNQAEAKGDDIYVSRSNGVIMLINNESYYDEENVGQIGTNTPTGASYYGELPIVQNDAHPGNSSSLIIQGNKALAGGAIAANGMTYIGNAEDTTIPKVMLNLNKTFNLTPSSGETYKFRLFYDDGTYRELLNEINLDGTVDVNENQIEGEYESYKYETSLPLYIEVNGVNKPLFYLKRQGHNEELDINNQAHLEILQNTQENIQIARKNLYIEEYDANDQLISSENYIDTGLQFVSIISEIMSQTAILDPVSLEEKDTVTVTAVTIRLKDDIRNLNAETEPMKYIITKVWDDNNSSDRPENADLVLYDNETNQIVSTINKRISYREFDLYRANWTSSNVWAEGNYNKHGYYIKDNANSKIYYLAKPITGARQYNTIDDYNYTVDGGVMTVYLDEETLNSLDTDTQTGILVGKAYIPIEQEVSGSDIWIKNGNIWTAIFEIPTDIVFGSVVSSGVYDGLSWKIVEYTDGTVQLQLGDLKEPQTMFFNNLRYNTDYPWYPYLNDGSQTPKINDITFLNTVYGKGSYRGMFRSFTGKNLDMAKFDCTEVTEMHNMLANVNANRIIFSDTFAKAPGYQTVLTQYYPNGSYKKILNYDYTITSNSTQRNFQNIFSTFNENTSPKLSGTWENINAQYQEKFSVYEKNVDNKYIASATITNMDKVTGNNTVVRNTLVPSILIGKASALSTIADSSLVQAKDLLLSGAEFDIYEFKPYSTGCPTGYTRIITSNNTNICRTQQSTKVVSLNKEFVSLHLEPGLYALTETSAPYNFLKGNANDYILFEVKEGNTLLIRENPNNLNISSVIVDNTALVITNLPQTKKIKVCKVNENNEPLTGAIFDLIDSSTGTTIGQIDLTTKSCDFTFNELEYGKEYKLHESQVPFGYNQTEDLTFTVSSEMPDEIVIKNTPTVATPVYDIRVEKTVTGSAGNKSKKFDFIVKITEPVDSSNPLAPVDLSAYGGISNNDGSYTFKLKHGEYFTLEDIPEGYQYEITEVDYSSEGYTTTVDEETGRTRLGTVTSDVTHIFKNSNNMLIPTEIRFTWWYAIPLALFAGLLFAAKKRKFD